jgi:hypothetical protein
MGTKPDKLEGPGIRLAVNQDEVGPDMAITMIVPLAAEGMVKIAVRQRLVLGQLLTTSSSEASRRLLCRPDFSRL